MRNLVMTVLLGIAMSSTTLAEAQTTSQKMVQSGASGSAYGNGPGAAFNFNVWQTATKGSDGQAQTYLSFYVNRQTGPDQRESIWGGGYVPASALKVTGAGLQVEVDDLATLPDFSLGAVRCEAFTCLDVSIDDAFRVDVAFTRIEGNSEERTGTSRRHFELGWPIGASFDVVEVGSARYATAAVSGVLGFLQLPLEGGYMYSTSIGNSHGATITLEHTR